MNNVESQLEALLSVSPRPLSVKKLSELTQVSQDDVRASLASLAGRLKAEHRGVALVRVDDEVRLGTAPELSELVERFVRDETTGELTRPQLETLTVVAYRGPVTKAELEQIRGVNCTMIIRNLLLRGLIEETVQDGLELYQVTTDFLSFLGVGSIAELPDYEALRSDKRIEDILNAAQQDAEPPAA